MMKTGTKLTDILTDVTIREGSQQEIDLRGKDPEIKLKLLELSVASGIKKIELTAFAPGEWFSDAEILAEKAAKKNYPAEISAIYFNPRGLETLLKFPALKAEGIFHTACTENYRTKNYNQPDIETVREKLKRMLAALKRHSLGLNKIMLSTAWGESAQKISPDETLEFAAMLVQTARMEGFNPEGFVLADTVGQATPQEINGLISAFKNEWPEKIITAHLHPQAALARECVHAAFEAGVNHWEASWCSLGGSPFADKPGGNLDIRILAEVARECGYLSGLNPDGIRAIEKFVEQNTGRSVESL
ncbi:MAG: hypothetical protein D6719_13860 [Candidatus Dadabacteria bacterium]|nr:MAG: hypothetical protein D6719_13860 [Candidatus Dadabacteria bacterium]